MPIVGPLSTAIPALLIALTLGPVELKVTIEIPRARPVGEVRQPSPLFTDAGLHLKAVR